jgi:hypothetical protein
MTEADIGDTLAPKSDQLDAVDLATGPRIFTVTECRTTKGLEQPTTIRFAEFPRPWKPGKNQRRVLAFCWGEKGALYVGRRVELYCDTSVVYAGEKVGGIRIRALSHIDGPMDAPIIPTRGKGGIWHVEPLTEQPPAPSQPTEEQIAASASTDQLGEWWKRFPPLRARIEARVAELRADPSDDGPLVPQGITTDQPHSSGGE